MNLVDDSRGVQGVVGSGAADRSGRLPRPAGKARPVQWQVRNLRGCKDGSSISLYVNQHTSAACDEKRSYDRGVHSRIS